MKKISRMVLSGMLMGCLLMGSSTGAAADFIEQASQMKHASVALLDNDTRVFKVNKQIEVRKVSFQNRYGFDVAGHLYLPLHFDKNKTYKAVVISGPFGAVKEQSSGLYAQTLAEKGFVALAFDQSMTGESSGVRRDMGSPDIFTEDYSAAVDFVSGLTFVDPEKIGAVGICGLSGMAITAAANDVRIKAVVTASMYDMSESISDHYNGAYYTPQQRNAVKQYLAQMRTEEALHGAVKGAHEIAVDANGQAQTFSTMFPDKLPEDVDPVIKEFYAYYVERAYHPRAINSNTSAWDATTPYGFFNFSLMENITEVSPRPIMFVAGAQAHSRYFTENTYAKAAEPKQKVIIENATHTDLYDNLEKIPFDQIAAFFNSNLK